MVVGLERLETRNLFHGDGGGIIHFGSNYYYHDYHHPLRFLGESDDDDNISSSKTTSMRRRNGRSKINMRLAPPQLRVMQNSSLDHLGIIIGENNCIKKGFAAAFSETLSTCCAHCRIVPLNNKNLFNVKGDFAEMKSWKNERMSHTYSNGWVHNYMGRTNVESTEGIIDLTQSTTSLVETRQSSRPRKVVNYKESTQLEDDRMMRKEDTSSSSSSSSTSRGKEISVENWDDVLCFHCARIDKDTNTKEGFTHGIILPTSRAQYEYAATKGQLARLPHVEKTWFGKPSKKYLRRHIIASTRARFGAFAKMLERKKAKKAKAPGSILNSKFLCAQFLEWGWGNTCMCGQHEEYLYDY